MRRLSIAVIVTAVLGTAIWFWAQPVPVSVVVRAVGTGAVEATVANTRAGTIMACRRSRLSPPSGGQVSVLHVREGDAVKEGGTLLELWNEDFRAQLRLAERELIASRSRTEEICLNTEMAKRELNRLRPLHRKKLVSVERLDRAETEALAREAACSAAKAAESVNDARVEVARAVLSRTILRAPFDGVVAEITGELGEVVTPSPPGIATPPAVDLIDCSCVYVSAPIDEVDAPAIHVGMPVVITLDAFPDRDFAGKVRRTAPYVLDLEKQARTVEVEVEFVNIDQCGELLPGYSADIEVILESRTGVVRIPTEAVLEGDRLLVLGADGLLTERHFTPGLSNWSYTEVLEGLRGGEQVVVSVDRAGVQAGVQAIAEPSTTPP